MDDPRRAGADRAFPALLPALRRRACVTVCPTGASYKRAEDGIVLVNEDTCIGCKLCSWACPYGAREYDHDDGVMKKCTLCVDRIYNENLPEEDRNPPACAPARPARGISATWAIPTAMSRGWWPSAAVST
jgi:Fe-S-cluster-containing dehydrogenase component